MGLDSNSNQKNVLLVGQPNAVEHKSFVLSDEVDLKIKRIQNGFDALEYVLSPSMPHLVIMDLLSDRINGLHFCYITKKLLNIKKIKIILFSEHSHRNNIIKGIQSGAADYIIDPCSDVLFKDRVLYHLYETSLNQQNQGTQISDEFPKWHFITSNKEGNIENIYLEKSYERGHSEIKKLIRNLHKKSFDSVELTECRLEEFNAIKKYSVGDLSRFIKPTKVEDKKEEQKTTKFEMDLENFGEKRLDHYKDIEPQKTFSHKNESNGNQEKRDRFFKFKDLDDIASSNPNLKVLLKIDKEINTNKDNHECMYNVTQQISSFIDATRASIIVPAEDKKTGVVLVANDDSSLENLNIDLSRYPEIQKTLETGEIVFIEDIKKSALLKSLPEEKLLDYSSIIVIPIWRNNNVIAVLSIRGKRGGKPISNEDIAFCQIIANTTAKTVAGNIFLKKIMSKFIPKKNK